MRDEEIHFVENGINYVRAIVRNTSGEVIFDHITPKGAKDWDKHEKLQKKKEYEKMDSIIKQLLGKVSIEEERKLRSEFMSILTKNDSPVKTKKK